MSCKCRDTNTRRCRWEFSTPEPYKASGYRLDGAPTRAQAKRAVLAEIEAEAADTVDA